MGFQQTIKVLHGGEVLAECGPMRLVISSFLGKVPQREMNIRAAEKSFEYLERVAGERENLRRPYSDLPVHVREPLALEMICSAMAIGDPDLTPMAAVAGTIADAVANYLAARGMTKVIVNNGGDVAVRLQGKDAVTVGIREDIRRSDFSHTICLSPERSSWGVATSGLGGRSLTKGVASAVTVIAHTASAADAAATAIANASFVKHTGVIQKTADSIDPETDIPGILVTLKVGPLEESARYRALKQAREKAEKLVKRYIIFGALVAVDGTIGMTDFFRECLRN